MTVKGQLPDYHVQLYDESYGMKSDMERVIKDNRGFIWLSSNEAVYRFDGKSMKEFPMFENANTLFCDNYGVIWLNSSRTVYQFKNDLEGFVPLHPDTSELFSFGKIFQLPGREVWLQSSNGFYEWNRDKQKFQKIDLSEYDVPSKLVTALFSNFENSIFFASGDSMYCIDLGNKTRYAMRRINDRGLFNAVSNHDLLITSRGDSTSWCDFPAKKITLIDFKDVIPGDNNDFLFVRNVLSIDPDHDLITSHTGLLELDLRTRRFRQLKLYHKGYPLDPTPNYFDMCIDKDRKVWMILGIGLVSFSPGKETIALIREREVKGEYTWPNNVRTFVEDGTGNLWIATSEGFGYWNLTTNEIKMHPAVPGAKDRLYVPSIRGLYFDGQYLIMGTSSSGVWLFDPKTEKYRRPVYASGVEGDKVREKFELEFTRQIVPSPDGKNYLIVANACYLMQKNNFQLSAFDTKLQETGRPNTSYIDKNKNVWLGTEEGVICFDSSLNYVNFWKTGMPVLSLHEFDDTYWWVGTYRGLYKASFTRDSVEIYKDTIVQDLTHIDFITTDKHGVFWIGCNQGLISYDPLLSNIELYDFYDNVQGNRFLNQPLFNKDGVMFIGGTNGINYFRPEKMKVKKDSLQVSLMKVTVNLDDSSFYERSAPLSLRYKQNSIEIEFMAPYYGNTNRLQYRYRLAGLSDEWKNNGSNNKVRFTSLAPGDYKFNVAASINGIHWYICDETFRFSIAYPFWQTWWFMFSCILILCGIIFYFVRKRINTIRQKEKIKREYEKRIAEVEMHALRAQMNPHFMFNSLNSINNFILKNDPDNASGYLTKFSRLMRLILDNSRSEWVLLENELKALELYIELEVVRFDHVFEYEIDVSPDIDVTTTSIPPMIIQPYVENAIWHGLLHRKKPGGKLSIKLNREDDLLLITIEDNGVGREEAKRLKSKSATKHKSHGMKITAERIEIVNRIYNVNAKVKIEDVVGQNGTVGGTKVSLTLNDLVYDSHHRG